MQALRVGIGGPVGSGKTALTLNLCLAMREHYEMAVVTNDIYTHEDAQFPHATTRWTDKNYGRRDRWMPTHCDS